MMRRRVRGSGPQRLMNPVLRRLSAFHPLSPQLAGRIEALEPRVETAPVGRLVMDVDPRRPRPRYLVEGWVCRFRLLQDGRRQLFRLLIPGDGMGICFHPTAGALAPATALTKAVLVDASPLLDSPDEEFQALANQIAAYDEVLLMDQIVRLGRQNAYERAAHLLVELGERFKIAGLGGGDAYRFPLTQDVLADMLGLSVVHMNRTLQQLKRDGLIGFVRGEMRLFDIPALKRLSDYQTPRASPLSHAAGLQAE